MLDNDTSNINNNNWNPQKLSLSELKLTLTGQDGVRSHVPALDEHWVKRDKPFSSYICQIASYGRLKTGAALEEWTHRANNCKKDFEFLLSLNQHEFWSYMVYEESAMAAIVTFLQRANPFYRSEGTNDDTANTNLLYEELLNLVMRIILRLCTSRESATEWITTQQHSELLYSNYLISIPLLFDLIIALGDSNPQNLQLLRDIFAVVLNLPAEYSKDLREALAFYENAFLSMQIQVENEGCEGAGGGAFLDADSTETPYDDVVLFALDCAHTLRVLMALSGDIKNWLETMEQLRLGQSIANFYDLTVPMLYRNIYMINPQAPSLRWLNEVRQQFLAVIRSIILAQVEAGRGQQLVDLLQECLSAQSFVIDYQRQFPIKDDVGLLLQRCPSIKIYKVDFVLGGYEKALSNCTLGIMADEYEQDQEDNDDDDDDEEDYEEDEDEDDDDKGAENATNSKNRDIDLEVSAVLDVLPDLGMGFIRRLLSRYENSEQAIAAILDDNLPPDLAQSDRQEIYVPPDPQDKLERQTGVKHYNVHDGDRYDILTQNKPQCIIKQGKGLPGAPRNAEQLLDDKRDLSQLKSRYQQYTLVEDTTNHDSSAEYDDEYDDSYEALNAGQAPPMTLLRAKLQSDASAANSAYEAQDAEDDNVNDTDSESTDDEANGSPKPSRRGMDFCENPEITRARYQQRQMAKYGQKTGGQQTSQQQFAVIGDRPKGQGQSQQTQRNRNQKEAHKSSRANHNRKAGAAFKRSKGMLS